MRNVGDHLAVYHRLSGTPPEPKQQAQQRLRADSRLLDDWLRRGEPLRYGLGLYQGMRLIPPVEAAINSWTPPPPPRPVIKKIVQGPQTVRLDSMSLFDTGKWALKPGSVKLLVNSLVGIKAKPGWLIVVAGHTDSTGDDKSNQVLSLKRAESVRDWMRDTGDVPETCFAVQGYGENLFTLEADPLTISGLESEYLLRPKRLQDGHTEIYSVDSVNGSGRTGEAHYVPFTSFRHQGGMMRRHAPERYYHTRVKRGVTGMHDTWLILGGQQWEADRMLERETVSLRITGTNGQLPRRALQSTLLDRCEQVYDTPLTVRNLCKPTLPAYPPVEDRFHWRVMSHLGSRFLNMMSSAEVLRGTLSLYNWREDELNNSRLDAILEVRHHRIQRFEDGFLLRGLDVEVTLDSHGFTGEGDIHLFGEMLNRFFALYADMNQFNQLTLIVQPEGKCIRWKENHSPRLPG